MQEWQRCQYSFLNISPDPNFFIKHLLELASRYYELVSRYIENLFFLFFFFFFENALIGFCIEKPGPCFLFYYPTYNNFVMSRHGSFH